MDLYNSPPSACSRPAGLLCATQSAQTASVVSGCAAFEGMRSRDWVQNGGAFAGHSSAGTLLFWPSSTPSIVAPPRSAQLQLQSPASRMCLFRATGVSGVIAAQKLRKRADGVPLKSTRNCLVEGPLCITGFSMSELSLSSEIGRETDGLDGKPEPVMLASGLRLPETVRAKGQDPDPRPTRGAVRRCGLFGTRHVDSTGAAAHGPERHAAEQFRGYAFKKSFNQGMQLSHDLRQQLRLFEGAWRSVTLGSDGRYNRRRVCNRAIMFEIACGMLLTNKTKVILARGYDGPSEENLYGCAIGREPTGMSRQAITARAGMMEVQGFKVHILTSAKTALEPGCPIRGIVAFMPASTQAVWSRNPHYSDRAGQPVPAPDRGTLDIGREIPYIHPAPVLNVAYRSCQRAFRRRAVRLAYCAKGTSRACARKAQGCSSGSHLGNTFRNSGCYFGDMPPFDILAAGTPHPDAVGFDPAAVTVTATEVAAAVSYRGFGCSGSCLRFFHACRVTDRASSTAAWLPEAALNTFQTPVHAQASIYTLLLVSAAVYLYSLVSRPYLHITATGSNTYGTSQHTCLDREVLLRWFLLLYHPSAAHPAVAFMSAVPAAINGSCKPHGTTPCGLRSSWRGLPKQVKAAAWAERVAKLMENLECKLGVFTESETARTTGRDLKPESCGTEPLQAVGFVYVSKSKQYLASNQTFLGVGGWLHHVQGKYHAFSETSQASEKGNLSPEERQRLRSRRRRLCSRNRITGEKQARVFSQCFNGSRLASNSIFAVTT
ncbi:uncharacterized protein B0H18DRAFT_959047 [Fomitopsis serialis]|uniref:uncharacterized protein n=1 Tax=Fomitopsis serialis TaxID=139415 RepID=UPI0020084C29|nr:uncharacterized protein B0H18DRAFT_959047 [Neoantrodia serialis]KAH9915994.1 hypothetical protein B0H18DRAFT_959047 [Neoantrodia serialis]